MKYSFLVLLFLFSISFTNAQNDRSQDEKRRTIYVTGSSEIEVEPDELILTIKIQEYWKEEFEKNKKDKDYRTKIAISSIENELLKDLYDLGVKKSDIRVNDLGNCYRKKGKDFLISKELSLALKDFKLIAKILENIDTKGIVFMDITEFKNSKLQEYKKQVKIDAIKAAKEKAEYLLSGIGEQLGKAVSIEEVNMDNRYGVYEDAASPYVSNSMVNFKSARNAGAGGDDSQNTADIFKKIKLRYEIKACFEIK
jgi:uncharacterized protein YggE